MGQTISDTVAEHGAKAGEMVDVVDREDKVLRAVTRVEAMREGLRYRFIQVLVFNKKRELWVQWRSKHKVICPRQFGASVGGVVEAGETYEQAAVRELQEEMGIEGVMPVLLGKYQTDGEAPYNAATFMCVHDTESPVGWESEAEEMELVSEEEAFFLLDRFPYLMTDGLRNALNMLDEQGGE